MIRLHHLSCLQGGDEAAQLQADSVHWTGSAALLVSSTVLEDGQVGWLSFHRRQSVHCSFLWGGGLEAPQGSAEPTRRLDSQASRQSWASGNCTNS